MLCCKGCKDQSYCMSIGGCKTLDPHIVETFGEINGATERDPSGIGQHEAGAKLDAGKPMAGTLGDFGLALGAVAEVGTFGAKKYSRGGWQSVENGIERYTDATWRHLLKENREDKDGDSGLSHAAHMAWNALARLELIIRNQDT